MKILLFFTLLWATCPAILNAQCCANGPNLLAGYNPDFSAPIPAGGVPPGFQTDNTFNNNNIGVGNYLITASRSYGACGGSPQYDHTYGNGLGKFLWFDTPGGASASNPAIAWRPYDPALPAGLQNLVQVSPNTNYVFSAWVRDLARDPNCVSGGAPVMGMRINGQDMAEINLGMFTTPCCPDWIYLCCYWNSGNNTTARLVIESRTGNGWTDLGLDDIYFGTSSAAGLEEALGPDTTLCTGDTLVLVAPFPKGKNKWNGKDTGAIYKVTHPGIYWLDVVDNNCVGSDTIKVSSGKVPVFTLGNDTSFCQGIDKDIFPIPEQRDVSYKWYNNSSAPVMNIKRSGIYWLDLSNECGTTRDSIIITVAPLPELFLPDDIRACLAEGDSVDLKVYALPEGVPYSYHWTPADYLRDDFSAANRFAPPVGDYQLFVSATTPGGCVGKDSIQIHILSRNLLSVSPVDTLIYYGDEILLQASGAEWYEWSPAGSLNQSRVAAPLAGPVGNTVYQVVGRNEFGCRDTAFVTVKVIFPDWALLPSAFSPNGDGNNDVFKLMHVKFGQLLAFRIYNRWGHLLFETSNPEEGWDGTYKNEQVQLGTYYYQVMISQPDGTKKMMKGDVTLMR